MTFETVRGLGAGDGNPAPLVLSVSGDRILPAVLFMTLETTPGPLDRTHVRVVMPVRNLPGAPPMTLEASRGPGAGN
eukprot:10509878-Prorocentrum_lima.AAC.1